MKHYLISGVCMAMASELHAQRQAEQPQCLDPGQKIKAVYAITRIETPEPMYFEREPKPHQQNRLPRTSYKNKRRK